MMPACGMQRGCFLCSWPCPCLLEGIEVVHDLPCNSPVRCLLSAPLVSTSRLLVGYTRMAPVNSFSTVNSLLLLQVFHLLHGHNLEGAVEVVPGEQHTAVLTETFTKMCFVC